MAKPSGWHRRTKPKPTTTEAGLGWEHQQRRAKLLPLYLGTRCPIGGPRCDGLMVDTRRMHLDHTVARALGGIQGDRIVCGPCNVWLGAKLGQRIRSATVSRRRRSARW